MLKMSLHIASYLSVIQDRSS